MSFYNILMNNEILNIPSKLFSYASSWLFPKTTNT